MNCLIEKKQTPPDLPCEGRGLLLELGSNFSALENLAFARRRLRELFPNIRFGAEQWTEAVGCRLNQAPFLNQEANFHTTLSADEVKALLKGIEREAGRTPEEKAREVIRLDIDLVAIDGRRLKPSHL